MKSLVEENIFAAPLVRAMLIIVQFLKSCFLYQKEEISVCTFPQVYCVNKSRNTSKRPPPSQKRKKEKKNVIHLGTLRTLGPGVPNNEV